MISIRAHFDGKVFVPDEPVSLPTDESVTLHIEARSPKPKKEVSALQWIEDHAIDSPDLPSDLSTELDHYLYGLPKRGR